MAHLPTHVFFTAESKQNGHQGDAGTPSSRFLPSHIGYVYPSDHASKEKGPEQCHTSSARARCGCRLIDSCSCSLFVPTRKRLIGPKTLAPDDVVRHSRPKLCLFCAYKNSTPWCKLLKRFGVPDGI